MSVEAKLTPMYLCESCNVYLPAPEYTKHMNGKHES